MDYLQQIKEIEKRIKLVGNDKKEYFTNKFNKAMQSSGGIHRIKLTALHSELKKLIPYIN